MIYFIADAHFGHNNIIKYENRPFLNIDEMDTALIKKWNSVVNSDDTVYILGDFTLKHNFEKVKYYFDQLNGHKILIRGNHDALKEIQYLKMGFQSISDCITLENLIDGRDVILSHYPPELEDINEDTYYLYGHVHSKWCAARDQINTMCVCCECIDYTPISLNAVINYFHKNS